MSKLRNAFLWLIVIGGLLLFIMLAPILITAVWLLFWGTLSLAIVSFIVWILVESLKE